MYYSKARKQYREALKAYEYLKDRLLCAMPGMPGYGEKTVTVLSSELGGSWSVKRHLPQSTYTLIEKELADMPVEELPYFFNGLMNLEGVRHKGVWHQFNEKALEAVRACLSSHDEGEIK